MSAASTAMLDKAPEESENAGLTVSNADHGPALSEPCEDDIIEPRAHPTHDPRNGRFTSGGKGAASGKPNMRRPLGQTTAK